jgi:hypothetical protein
VIIVNSSLESSLARLALADASESPPEATLPVSPRAQRPKSGKRLALLLPSLSDIKMPTGEESANDLREQLAYYEQRRDQVCEQIKELKRKPELSTTEQKRLDDLHTYEMTLDEAIAKTQNPLTKSGRKERKSYRNFSLKDLAASRERYIKGGLDARDKEVDALVSRLQRLSDERMIQLESRLGEIKNIIKGQPAEKGGPETSTKIFKSLTELWRLAPTTSVVIDGEVVQTVHPDAHDTATASSTVDTRLRFLRIIDFFRKKANDDYKFPNMREWNYDNLASWADGEKDTLERASTLTEKMRRYIRSGTQALFTGSLTHKDVIELAPNLPGTPNKLFAAVPRSSQEIARCFFDDGSSEINIKLPFELKNRDHTPYAKFVAVYHIGFDDDMEPVSLSSQVLEVKTFHKEERSIQTS